MERTIEAARSGVMQAMADLRWKRVNYDGGHFEKILQQAWRDMDTGEIEWADVPIVLEPA